MVPLRPVGLVGDASVADGPCGGVKVSYEVPFSAFHNRGTTVLEFYPAASRLCLPRPVGFVDDASVVDGLGGVAKFFYVITLVESATPGWVCW